MSVEFEPVRLGQRRRRIDPVFLAAVVVAIGLVFSVIKPWGEVQTADRVAIASVAPDASEASPFPTASATLPRVLSGRAASPPIWPAVAPVIQRHEAWGVRAIVIDGSTESAAGDGRRYSERWFRFANGGAATSTAFVDPGDRSIVALGVTFPPAHTPLDVRIWRAAGGGLEWIDTEPVESTPSGGAFLYVRPGIAGGLNMAWTAGTYRIDVLVDGAIQRFGVMIPDRFSNVLDGTKRPNLRDVDRARDSSDPTLPDVPIGLFATVDGIGVPMPADEGGSLDEVAAWLDVDPGTRRAPRSFVATAYLPRATRLGVMLPPRSTVVSATLARLAPEPLPIVTPVIDHTPRDAAPNANVMFRPPDGGAWTPGVYRITVRWADSDGLHELSWHAELRAGPVREFPRLLAAARSWARYAGETGVILGTTEPLIGGPRSAVIRLVRLRPDDAAYPVGSDIGCGGTVIDGNPAILGFAYPDDQYASTVTARILRPFLRRGEQVVMTAAFGLGGLILVAPARRPILAPGTYRFTVGDGDGSRDYALCLDMQTFDD